MRPVIRPCQGECQGAVEALEGEGLHPVGGREIKGGPAKVIVGNRRLTGPGLKTAPAVIDFLVVPGGHPDTGHRRAPVDIAEIQICTGRRTVLTGLPNRFQTVRTNTDRRFVIDPLEADFQRHSGGEGAPVSGV